MKVKQVLTAVAVSAALSTGVWAQSAPAAGQGPNWKDRAEYDLVQSIQGQTDPTKRLELLNQWKQKYPETEFKKHRAGFYLDTYEKLKDTPNLIQAANDLISADPKDVPTLVQVVALGYRLNSTDTAVLDMMDKAAQSIVDNIGTKPAAVTDEQWKTQGPQTEAYAHRARGWVAQQKKDMTAAHQHYSKSLQVNPAQADLSYLMGQQIIGQKDENTYATGLYHIARASVVEGQGAMAPADRAKVEQYLQKAYAGFHGSAQGLDEVKNTAKANALPPPGFKILSIKEVTATQAEKDKELAAQNPKLALWKRIREELSGPGGQQYFDSSMKDAAIPPLTGYLIEQRPKELVLGITDRSVPEITLQLDTAMAGTAEPGTQLDFSDAIGKTFTKEPFMVTMEIDRKNIKGWPTPAAKKPAARKPGAARKKR